MTLDFSENSSWFVISLALEITNILLVNENLLEAQSDCQPYCVCTVCSKFSLQGSAKLSVFNFPFSVEILWDGKSNAKSRNGIFLCDCSVWSDLEVEV